MVRVRVTVILTVSIVLRPSLSLLQMLCHLHVKVCCAKMFVTFTADPELDVSVIKSFDK